MWFIPELTMLITSIVIFVVIRSLNKSQATNVIPLPHVPSSESIALRKQLGSFLSMVALLMAGVLRPSLPSAVYFIVFLGSATWWACFKELDRTFARIIRYVVAFLMVHITVYLTYQTPYPQQMFPKDEKIIRYMFIRGVL